MSITVIDVPLDKIHEADWNPRQHFDPKKLAELAESLRQKGLIQPLVVRPRPSMGMCRNCKQAAYPSYNGK